MEKRDTGRKMLAGLALALLVAACSTPMKRAEQFAAQDEWMRAVLEYRRALADDPGNVEYRSRLKQTELKAADFYYQRGIRLLEQGSLDGATLQFQQGLAAMPDHPKLQQAMAELLARREAESLYAGASAQAEGGNVAEAKRLYQAALDAWPRHKGAALRLAALIKQAENDESQSGLALSSRNPVTLNFRNTDLRTAFEFLARSFGINMIFDENFKSTPVTLYAKDVTFEQGLNLLLTTSRTFYKKIGSNTILVAPDTKEKRGQYEDHLVRTFQLNSIGAKEMGDILKGLINVKKMILNEELNNIIIRDTEEVLKLTERIIEANDRKPAEMILDVEILEVNRSKAERLGLDLGSYSVSATVPSYGLTGSLRRALNAGSLTVPSATFRFFKQDVDARTLATPKIRVLNGKEAKIHIGDRVPLRSATIQDATGQVRTTFDYRDIGIRLLVQPDIHLDNSATVKLGLEVSSLGENVGTANEPAFRIGTRNADTHMLLRDGETAILGGLIRDEERSTQVKLPGLGDIPVLGWLFTADDRSAGRTDVLLTITPRVVRGWDLPGRMARQFYSGSENVYTTQPLFAYLGEDGNGARPKIDTSGAAVADAAPALPDRAAISEDRAITPALDPSPARGPVLAFDQALYEVAGGEELQLRLVAENLDHAGPLDIELLYNPQLLGFGRAVAPGGGVDLLDSQVDEDRGLLRLRLDYRPAEGGQDVVLTRLSFRGSKPGVSYLICRAPSLKDRNGGALTAQVRASRVLVK